jgi:four helix bundle protein
VAGAEKTTSSLRAVKEVVVMDEREGRAARCFRDLMVYRKAREVSRLIFEMTQSFPREETYSLVDQVRRSSRSVGAQIAEAWGKRRYEKHFVSKLTDADAEQLETQHWLETAVDSGYLNEKQAEKVCAALKEIGKMLNSMIAKAGSFCRPDAHIVREDPERYFVKPSSHQPKNTRV